MKWHKRIRRQDQTSALAVDVNAAIAVNRGEPETVNTATSVSHVRVVQDSRPGANRPGAQPPANEQEESK